MDTLSPILLDEIAPQLESTAVLKALILAHRYLAELKGVAKTIPNDALLLSTLTLQEAQDSSEIENIITTQDALYKYQLHANPRDIAAKEVSHYANALSLGFTLVQSTGLLTINTILAIQAEVEQNKAGFRKILGTVLKNEQSGEVIYKPPTPEKIQALMGNLEQLINIENKQVDPLIKMALIHHQFESIHPFYDGNGRTGRIINILYLCKEGLLDIPTLYLSRYINHTKTDYYRLLQQVRNTADWEEWLLYILKGVELTAKHAITLIESIKTLLQSHKESIRLNHKFYSQELMNSLFKHPYTKVQFLENDLNISRATASRYLNALSKEGILAKQKMGRENYYINSQLVDLLFNTPRIFS
jgi:Fic family protein